MNRRTQWLVVSVIAMAAVASVAVGIRALSSEFAYVTVGSRAPTFSALTLESPPVARTIADYHGYVTILNVWATWCGPCRVEMPSLQRLHDQFADKGLRIVAISVDAPGMEQPIRDFAAELGLTFDILYDSPGAVQRDYMTRAVPETFIIGKDGIIRAKELGYREWDSPDKQALIARLLDETADS